MNERVTYVLSCPYCAVKVVGNDEAQTWVRWLLGDYAQHHLGSNGPVPPNEMKWEKVPKP